MLPQHPRSAFQGLCWGRQSGSAAVCGTQTLRIHLLGIDSSQKRLHTYIFVFGINFPNNYISVTRKYFSGINFPKITFHVFVCDSENYMEKCFWNYFLGKSHFQLHEIMFSELHLFFAHPFSFFCPVTGCPPHPSPGNFSSPISCLSGSSYLLFLVEKRQPPGAGFWGRLWTGSPHRKKRKILFFWRAKKFRINFAVLQRKAKGQQLKGKIVS